ncbi:SUMF1/EgtB/PvdO family nonheme iron enzyme [Chitinophaga pendula]|uniref:SUMF1/EgtB/PvdO family nonheme iron enzyme n=1 Tax=Chitinophaga TaxID=79328 RepID=UPI000BB01735|nr:MULTISPECIES: SUMF1/EgtB/PvdO family nonheme iron enzyme [Chitinophaga]ASZ11210.1 hypothetical protein CK934_09660 [Chitinophaga sp. MD30]UCJ05793.1 SUMF1/EgtB/PvdO family nonheme iron enzyme [Chitinophaga pendula]
MIGRYKYDVAISVAEEDCQVADLVAPALRKENLSVYYYRDEDNAGQNIMGITMEVYGKQSRSVLVVTSKRSVKKYWAKVELQMVLNRAKEEGTPIVQLKLDNTPIDGISNHTLHYNWENNPEQIAVGIKEKIKKYKRTERVRAISRIAPVLLLALALIWSLSYQRSIDKQKHIQPLMQTAFASPVGKKMAIVPNGISANINPFFISATEVTITEYREFCQEQKMDMPPQDPLSDGNTPVTNITWSEALAYCKWKKGRLPTETEWEYAASAGQTAKYSGGNNAAKVAVYRQDHPEQVATKVANDFGLFDMTGNVAEWCNDWIDAAETWKAVRGGAYIDRISPLNELAVSFRSKEHPDTRSPYIGFRVAWDE